MKSCTAPPEFPPRLRWTLTPLLAPGVSLYHQDCPAAANELLKAGLSTTSSGRSMATIFSESPVLLAEFCPTKTSPRLLAFTSHLWLPTVPPGTLTVAEAV